MIKRAGRIKLVLFCALIIFASRSGFSQVERATIMGTVQDTTGAVIPGATVSVTNVDTNATIQIVTDEAGRYTATALAIGNYQVSASHPGFKTQAQTGIRLHTQDVARLDLTLQVGEITEGVTVGAAAPLLEINTSSLGQVVETKTIVDLPLNGRNYLQLVRLAPGVLEPPTGDRAAAGGSFVANGVRATLNNFILDGVDNNSRILDIQNSSNVVIQPSVDALAEFKVQTHNFSAEFGHSAGAVINASIKSGTNKFHGTAFEFLRNSVFDARDFFSRPADKKPLLIRNQFGGTVGGPVMRDKTFFFASWEGARERRGITFVRTVPTAAMRQGDFSGERPIFDPNRTRLNPLGPGFVRDRFPGNRIPPDRFDPVAVRVLELVPLPNLPGRVNNYVVTRAQQDARDQYDFRIDHQVSASSRLFGRFSFMSREFNNPGPFPPPLIGASVTQQAQKIQAARGLAIGQTQTFSTRSINELRLGYNRIRDDLFPFVKEHLFDQYGFRGIPLEPSVTGLPHINISGFTTLGEATFLPNLKVSETYQVNDNLSLIRGRHDIKTGFNFRFVRSFFDVSGAARGNFAFSGVFTQDPQDRARTGSAPADFLLGLTSTSSLSTLFVGDVRYQYWGFYIQDDWKAAPKLTFNFGARYELITQPHERHDRQAIFLLDQRKLAFPKNVIPAGIPNTLVTTLPPGVSARALLKTDKNNFAPRLGLAYEWTRRTVLRLGFGVFYADHPSIGASGRLVANPPFRSDKSFPTDQITPQIILRNGFPLGTLDPLQFDPSDTAFQGWSTEFPQAYTYHWNLDLQHEFPGFLLDVSYTGTKGTQLPVGFDINAPLAGAGPVARRRPIQGFGPVGRQQPMNNSHYHALQIKGERRFAQGLAFLASYTLSKSIDLGGEQLIGQDQLIRDPRNIRAERSLSLFDMRHRFVWSYLWDLPFGSGHRLHTNLPILDALLGNWQINGITTLRGGTPFTPELGFSSANTGHPRPNRIRDGRLPDSQRTLQHYFDTEAFPAPTPFAFGNSGKNVLRGPGAVNFDFSLFKNIPLHLLGEGAGLQFRVEFFNLMNTPQFDDPNPRVDIPQGGSITRLRNNMREMQFGLKLAF